MAGQTEELIGHIDSVVYRSEESGWSVFRLRTKSGLHNVTGSFTALHHEEYIRLIGHWVEHPTYGSQFRSIRKIPHDSAEAIARYLASRKIKGIGTKTATKIAEHFGKSTLDILDQTPYRMEEVPSIGKKKMRDIVEAWEPLRRDRMVEVFLASGCLSPQLGSRIIKHFGDDTIGVLTENPYRLVELPRIGFLTADHFAQQIGIEPDSKERIKAAVLHLLKTAADDKGHCFLTESMILEGLEPLIGIDSHELIKNISIHLHELCHAQLIKYDPLDDQDKAMDRYYPKHLHYAECQVASKIHTLLAEDHYANVERVTAWLEHYHNKLPAPLSDQQYQAVLQAAQHKVFVLTGGPGVGKSTTANAIIKMFLSMSKTVALCAPTGRAAQRLSEITGQPCQTIHRLLEWNAKEGGFKRCADNPLAAQVVIVDEASMLDIRLAYALIQAVGQKSQIIFIGDVDQLPSVGPGYVLGDLINSQTVPFIKLSKVFRQAAQSDIIRLAHELNMAKVPHFSNTAESDCRFIEVECPRESVEVIRKLICDILPEKRGYDPLRDIQILTPMKRTDLGTQKLNDCIQEALNPSKGREYKFRHGILRKNDKVIQCTNNYELGVFNGDIGIIDDVSVKGGKVLISFGDRQLTYSESDVDQLQLAYAITIHKSQGSEFSAVIIPVTTQHYIMLQKNLIYTALTRAKQLAIFVGSQRALKRAATTSFDNQRCTGLRQRLGGSNIAAQHTEYTH